MGWGWPYLLCFCSRDCLFTDLSRNGIRTRSSFPYVGVAVSLSPDCSIRQKVRARNLLDFYGVNRGPNVSLLRGGQESPCVRLAQSKTPLLFPGLRARSRYHRRHDVHGLLFPAQHEAARHKLLPSAGQLEQLVSSIRLQQLGARLQGTHLTCSRAKGKGLSAYCLTGSFDWRSRCDVLSCATALLADLVCALVLQAAISDRDCIAVMPQLSAMEGEAKELASQGKEDQIIGSAGFLRKIPSLQAVT